MDVIIHIGQHKTGTTSFQHMLKEKRLELLKLGFYFPESLAGFAKPSHFVLNLCSLAAEHSSPMKDIMTKKGAWDPSALSQVLRDDLDKHYQLAVRSNCHTMIFTNEGLYLLQTAEEYQRLKRFFDFAHKITCICTFRDKESFASSYKKQLVKQGIVFSSDKTHYSYVAEDSWLYDYDAKKELLDLCFDNTFFLKYCAENAIKNLLDAMKINLKVDDTTLRLNVTP